MPVNKNKRPVNTIEDVYEQYERELSRQSIQSQQVAFRKSEAEDKLSAILATAQGQPLAQRDVTEVNRLAGSVQAHQRHLENLQDVRGMHAQNRLVGGTERLSRPEVVSAEVNRAAGSTGVYGRAYKKAMGMTTAELEAQRNLGMAAAGQWASVSVAQLETEEDPRKRQQMAKQIGARREQEINRAAIYQTAMDIQRRQKLDTASQDLQIAGSAQKARNELRGGRIVEAVASGDVSARTGLRGVDSIEGVSKRLTSTLEAMDKAQRRLMTSTNLTSKEADQLRARFKVLEQGADDLRAIQGTMGGGGGRAGRIAGGFSVFAAAAQAVTDVAQEGLITAPIQTRLNQAGFAQIANTQYNQAEQAMGGNMLSLMMTGGGDWEKISESAAKRYRRQQGVLVTGQAARTGGLATEGITDISQQTTMAGAGGGTAAAGIRNIGRTALGVADLARTGIQLETGTIAGQTSLADVQANLKMLQTVKQVPAKHLQQYSDFIKGQAVVTRGAGATHRDAILQGIETQEDAMAGLGLTGGEINQAVGMGVEALGGQFKAEDVTQARLMERRGLGTRQQFFQRAGAMAQVGGGVKDMEDTLKLAVSKGMDSSKAIDMMVSATTSMSEQFIRGGVAAGGTIQQQLFGAMGAGADNSFAAIKQAQSALENINAGFGNDALTIQGIMEGAGVDKVFGTVGTPNQRRALRRTSMTDLAQIAKGGAGAREVIEAKGLGAFFQVGENGQIPETQRQQLKQLQNLKIEKSLAGDAGGYLSISDKFMQQVIKHKEKETPWSDLPKEVKEEFAGIKGGIAGVDPEKAWRVMMGKMAKPNDLSADVDKGTASVLEKLTEFLGRWEREQRKAGGKDIGPKGIATAMEAVFDNFTEKGLKEWEKVPAEMANKFDVPAKHFGIKVDTFSAAVDKFDEIAGSRRGMLYEGGTSSMPENKKSAPPASKGNGTPGAGQKGRMY